MPEYILEDNGDYGLDQIEYAYSRGVIPIIPARNDAMKAKGTYSDIVIVTENYKFYELQIF